MAEEIVKSHREQSLDADMRNYGIKRVPVDYFHVCGFRYTDAKDAVAQAKRVKTANTSV